MAQLTTALSDLILAVSCLYCVWMLTNGDLPDSMTAPYIYSISGFILIMIAASLGVVRFGMTFPTAFLVKCHEYASFLASVVGLSCLAAEFCRQANYPLLGEIHVCASLLAVALQLMVSPKVHSVLTEAVSSAAVVSILLLSALLKNVLGGMGALAIVFASVAVGTEGQRFGFPAVDFFHYTLAVANILLVHALTQ